MRFAHAAAVAIGCAAVWAGGFGDSVFAQPSKGCTIVSASPVAFGNYDSITGAPLDVQGQIVYECGKGAGGKKGNGQVRDQLSVQISVNQGTAGTFNRQMEGGRDRLRYNLYLDAARIIIWGDGTGGTQTYAATAQPNGQLVTVPVFGRLFAGQDVAGGVYLDNLVVTLDF